MNKIHRSIFLKEVKEQFPQLRSELNFQDGLLYFEVQVFLKFVQACIDEGDRNKTRSVVSEVNRYFAQGTPALVEAIRIGICEDVRFEDS